MSKTPAAHEALAEGIPFTYGDHDYIITPSSEWDLDALEAFENGKLATFLRLVLGEEQYSVYKQKHPKVGELEPFVVSLQKALGIKGN
jgi:hypothetical protein